MNNRSFFVIFMATLLSSCATRMTPGEKLLFPDPAESKWWIVNVITNDTMGNRIHLCGLLSTETENVKNYIVFFSSLWMQADSSFYSSIQATDNPDISSNARFPLTIGTSETSAGSEKSNWVLKRKTMHWQASMKSNNPASAPAPFSMDLSFMEQKPFSFSKMSSSPAIWAIQPIVVEVNQGNLKRSNIPGHLFIRTITGKEILLNDAKNNDVSWIDLIMNDGKKLSLLLKIAANGEIKIASASFWDELNNIFYDPSLQVKQTGNSVFPRGKNYPLFLSVTSREKNYSFLVAPALKEQQLVAGKRSLWMGAIEAVDTVTGRKLGAGNMYIFGQ